MKFAEYLKKSQEKAFLDFVLAHPTKHWDKEALCANPNVTWEMIEKYPNVFSSWDGISRNPNLKFSNVLANLDKNWSWFYLSRNKCVDIEVVKNNPQINWNGYDLSLNSNMTYQIVDDNPQINWFYPILVSHLRLTDTDIKNRCHPGYSHNFYLTEAMIEDNLECFWDWRELCIHPNLSFDFYKRHLSKINFYYISSHPNVTAKMIRDNPQMPWVWSKVSSNPNLDISLVKENLDKDWNWYCVTTNPGITFADIKANSELSWINHLISKNPNITPEIIRNNPDEKWDWFEFSSNENMTFEFINSYINQDWDWSMLSRNKFTAQNKMIEEQCRKEWNAAKVIKRNWVRVFWDPTTKIGKKRLERSYLNEEYTVW